MRKPDLDPSLIADIASRSLSHPGGLAIERATEGGTTQVYRIRRGAETFYLRVAETAEVGDLGQEALVHHLLRERGVRVPEVIHYEPFDEDLGRSFMVTTEIAGTSLADNHVTTDLPAVLAEAGRDLAVINSLHVEGFGWITSDPAPSRLTAELSTHRAFVFETFDADLSRLQDDFLTSNEIATIRCIVARHDSWLDVEQAHLAHGDFDATHIYHQHGRYAGIIDFGEIRGADRLYDLGHYALHDGETLHDLSLPHLIAGYRDVAPLSDEDLAHIQLWCLLIGVRAFTRVADRLTPAYHGHLALAIRRAIAALGP
jgi:Ser/Thr protein kinase RdoA (MazF antagonist)